MDADASYQIAIDETHSGGVVPERLNNDPGWNDPIGGFSFCIYRLYFTHKKTGMTAGPLRIFTHEETSEPLMRKITLVMGQHFPVRHWKLNVGRSVRSEHRRGPVMKEDVWVHVHTNKRGKCNFTRRRSSEVL